jgi:hypothetical protein
MEGEELLVPFPVARSAIPRATAFRSTWVVSSLAGLRLHGYFDRYREGLAEYESEILSCVAGSWLTIKVARAHYEACQSLGLRQEDVLEMAAGEAGSVRRTWHASMIGMAQREDATPWTVLSTLHKVWLRGADGGAVAVWRCGERQARVEYVGCELFDIAYFRHAVRAVLFIFAQHVCGGLQVTASAQQEPGQVCYQLRWS